MSDRHPYDFSALAPDFSQLEEEVSGPFPGRSPVAGRLFAEDALDEDFEAELERLTTEEQALSLDDAQVDAQFRVLQRALADLSESVADADLDAEEAWLDALLHEDSAETEGDRGGTAGR